jgi:hypothetical protein
MDDERRNVGAIERRLSDNSWLTYDPACYAEYLRRLDWVDGPTHSRSEHARLALTDATAIVYRSGLVIILTPGYDPRARGAR